MNIKSLEKSLMFRLECAEAEATTRVEQMINNKAKLDKVDTENTKPARFAFDVENVSLRCGMDSRSLDKDKFLANTEGDKDGYVVLAPRTKEVPKTVVVREDYNHYVTMINQPNTKEGLLSGKTLAIKDNVWFKDVVAEGGSDTLKGFVAPEHATVVSKLLDAGITPVGKTTLDEFGLGGTGLFSNSGITLNSKNKERIAGGSSSGSATTVGLGEVDIAIGTDTGDSVRKPASYQGVVGFKPTYGIISRYGCMTYDGTYDTVGFITQNVKDAALATELSQGHDPKDMTSYTGTLETYTDKMTGNLKGKKFYYINEFYKFYDTEYKTDFDAAVEKIKAAGAIVEGIDFGQDLIDALLPTYQAITFANAVSQLSGLDGVNFGVRGEGSTYEEMVIDHRTKGIQNHTKARLMAGAQSLAGDIENSIYLKARKVRTKIIARVDELMKEYDCMIMIAAQIAQRIDEVSIGTSPTVEFCDSLLIANHTGAPSISIPLGTKEGMPFGLEIMSKPLNDFTTLDVAFGIENLLGCAK